MHEPAPFFADVAEAPAGAEAFRVRTGEGLGIRIVHWNEGRRGTAFIFSGRSEYIEKYGRVITRLVARGFSVAAFDWRGQGLSTRPARNPMLGDVTDFRDYQRDWAAVRMAAEHADLPRPFFMLAHSMGACIGLRTIGENDVFAGAVMSAPMWNLHMTAATRQFTARLGQFARLAGFAERRLPGTNRLPSALALPFEGNVLTGCSDHFAWFGRQLRAHPELGLGGPSVRWTCAALEEMARLYAAPLPRIPVLVLLGTEEQVVSSDMIRLQTGKMARGELAMFGGARHEIWMERPEIQDRLWPAVDVFLARIARREASRHHASTA